MVKLVLVIIASLGTLDGCDPKDSSEPAGVSAAVVSADNTEPSHVPPRQSEPNVPPPPIIDRSQATEPDTADKGASADKNPEDGTAQTPPVTESDGDHPEGKPDTGEEPPPEAEDDKQPPPETDTDKPKADPDAEAAQGPPDDQAPKTESATEPADTGRPQTTANESPVNGAGDTELIEDKFQPRAAELYEKCRHILTTYVDKNGNVDYRNLRRKRVKLIAAVRAFEELDPREYMLLWSTREKTAFWINAYNILTLKLIVDNYPIKPVWYKITYPPNSIMQINGAWTRHYFEVMGIEYTLREIEREILLGQFKDPRICFALSYATMGGALLRNEPYYPDRLDEQLDDQIRKFLADPRGMRIDHHAKTIRLADIFNWYRNDFVARYGSVRKFRNRPAPIQAYLVLVARYIEPDNLRYLESSDYDVKFIRYDWRLNEQPRKR